MANEPQGFDLDLIKIITQFANGNLTIEEFRRKHKIKEREKWEEMKFIARDNYLLIEFLKKLPMGLRFKALKEVHALTEEDIKLMGFTSGIQRYFKGDLEEEPTISFFYNELAILLDVPVEYLTYDNPLERYVNINQFTEYKKTCKQVIELDSLCKEVLERPKNRIIKGNRVNNSNPIQFNQKDRELNVRIDKQRRFFCLEVFVNSYFRVDKKSIDRIKFLLGSRVKYVFYSDALLRDYFKISFIGTYDEKASLDNELIEHVEELKLRFRSAEITFSNM